MGRHWALVGCLGILLLGCKGSGQSTEPVDPFFGRVRIEPPRTGAIGSPSSVPYAPSLRPNPLRGSPMTPGTAPLSGGSSSNGPAGWVAAPASTTSNVSGAPAAGTDSGATALGTAGLPSPTATSGNRGVGAALALGQNPTTTPLGAASRPDVLQPFGTPTAPGDRIVIPPAAREVAGAGMASAVRQPQPGVAPATPPSTGTASVAGVAGSSLARAAAPLADTPTMSRPTINLASQRERIIRTLEPARGLAGSPLPQPLDAAGAPSASGPSSSPAPSATGSMAGTSPPAGAAGTPATSTGARFPNRLVDITELPVAPATR